MPEAVGVIETLGLPTALEAADALCKSGQVQFVRFDTLSAGLVSVIVRGSLAEVTAAMQGALASLDKVHGAVAGHHIVPCPAGNVEAVLPLRPGSGPGAAAPPDWLID